jgi:hypothetical protein
MHQCVRFAEASPTEVKPWQSYLINAEVHLGTTRLPQRHEGQRMQVIQPAQERAVVERKIGQLVGRAGRLVRQDTLRNGSERSAREPARGCLPALLRSNRSPIETFAVQSPAAGRVLRALSGDWHSCRLDFRLWLVTGCAQGSEEQRPGDAR